MTGKIRKYIAIGPESTGKSSLCEILADHYKTIWCPEYAREYLEVNGTEYTYGDLLTIAKGQLALEDSFTQDSRKSSTDNLVFIDTDMHVMRVWCEYVFGNCHKFILDQIAERRCDGYFLCAPDLPWEKDPLREYPNQKVRDELFLFYKELLTAQCIPWVEIRGSYEERTQKAIEFIG